MRRLALLSGLLGLLCLAAPAQSLPAESGPGALDTVITRAPDEGGRVENDAVGFAFEATREGLPFPTAGFRCTLDGGAAAPCSSPLIIEELDEGPHVFAVAAEDPLTGETDPVPATRAFVIVEGACDEEEATAEGEECETEGSSLPRECLLKSARATVSIDAERARLTLRYTTFAPTDARVSFRLGGARGSLRLGEARRHLARRGVVHLSEQLSKAKAARVRAGRRITVEIDVPGTPEQCRRRGVRRLTIKRTGHDSQTWLQSDPIFGPDA